MSSSARAFLTVLVVVALLMFCFRPSSKESLTVAPDPTPSPTPTATIVVSIQGVKLGDRAGAVRRLLGRPTREEHGPILCDPSTNWTFKGGPAIKFGVYDPGATQVEGFAVGVNGHPFAYGSPVSELPKVLGPPDAQQVNARHDYAEDAYCKLNLVVRHRGGKLKRAWLTQHFGVSDETVVKMQPDARTWRPKPLSEWDAYVVGNLMVCPR